MPGVFIQAVLAQSMSLRQWLTPISQAFTTALAAGLGVLLAAAQADRIGARCSASENRSASTAGSPRALAAAQRRCRPV